MESTLFSLFLNSPSDVFLGAWSQQSGPCVQTAHSLKHDWLAKLFCSRAVCFPEPGCWQVRHAQILKQVAHPGYAGCGPTCWFLREKRGKRAEFGEQRKLYRSGPKKKKRGQSGIPTPYCKAACWCLVPRKQTLAVEEMQGKGKDRDGLAELTQIGMSSIWLGISKHQREAYI